MPEQFDPYLKWLGIKPSDQPPHDYRLLAIDLFEDDPDIIENAAEQRTVYLRSLQLGEHSAQSQRILNEIAKAKIRLLSPEQKAAYDAALRTQLAPQQSTSQPYAPPATVQTAQSFQQVQPPVTAPVPVGVTSLCSTLTTTSKRPTVRKSAVGELVKIVAGGVAGLTLGYLILCWIAPRADFLGLMSESSSESVVMGDDVDRSAVDQPTSKMNPESNDPFTYQEEPQFEPPPKAKSQTTSKEDDPLQNLPLSPVANDNKEPAHPEESKADRIKRLTAERDAALAKGDLDAALKAVEEIAENDGGDLIERKIEVIIALQDSSDSPANFKVVAENLLRLLDQAISEKRKEFAERHIDRTLVAARKSGDANLVRRTTGSRYQDGLHRALCAAESR